MGLRHGSLFSGQGGFDLAAKWMNWENVFHCEKDPFASKILKYYFPESISYHDIKETNLSVHANSIDVLSGGFPCQPYSTAGKRKGKQDDRHLWPWMLGAVRDVKPPWVVGENVLGLVNWSGGLVFEEVCLDLEAEGYEVQPYILPAVSVNAPHRRDRVWFVAYNNDHQQRKQTIARVRAESGNGIKVIANSKSEGLEGSDRLRRESIRSKQRGEESYWENWPTQSPFCSGNDGIFSRLDACSIFNKPCKPRRSKAFPKWRNESIKCGGNAVVPQIPFQIFKTIEQYNNLLLNRG